ncbi:MAG: aminotransferase [Proteobacteria bacterium]|nr:aminotransferase [Pseudomonadota bacterium]
MSIFKQAIALDRVATPTAATLKGSMILGIAAQVRKLQASGKSICNLTVGDFRPEFFPIPEVLAEQVLKAYQDGQTNYPPSDGVPVLREAIAQLYKDELDIDCGIEAVCVASGARPPLFSSWMLLVEPGDVTCSFLPAWNNGYYAHMFHADHRFVPTTAENNFHPTAAQVEELLPVVKMIAINSPLNPTGTVIDKEELRAIATLIVEENKKRESKGEKAVMLQYDQVYWMLTEEGYEHYSPVSLVPEIAPYVIHIDAISKAFAATGLRVGWSVLPHYLQPKMKALIGHMGAWAARPEQIATAWLLNHPEERQKYLTGMKQRISERLNTLYQGILSMKQEGLPVDAISPQGAIYLSFHVGLIGRGFSTNEEIRNWLLEEAHVAVVPFQAFDLRSDTGWFRMSVGAASVSELGGALERIRSAILKTI